MKKYFLAALFCLLIVSLRAASHSGLPEDAKVGIWDRMEISLVSETEYTNPLYDVREFHALFTAPSGRQLKINGFWDGGLEWKIRFMPDETGPWKYETLCSDTANGGLHGTKGSFICSDNIIKLDLYQHGAVRVEKGSYHLSHQDGAPFFWLACTAWNGGLKSTLEEWEHYLEQRSQLGYNVIQLVGTQWRGCDQNSEGQVAFSGSGRITLNPAFFQHFDGKMDRINAHGHLAALVLLWALPVGGGTELSPGYYLPDREAILLARYMVARYGAHHVSWLLGGDGKYWDELEDRWKYIGQEVFRDKPQGISTTHPMGGRWIGDVYGSESWYEIDGYQSSHSTSQHTIDLINKTVGEGWKDQSPKPVINLEPCYEEIQYRIFEDDVRNACYWSVFATPPAGITYGADGIWPWIRKGETALNHRANLKVSTWDKAIELPGSKQIAKLGAFMREFEWWNLKPAQELLLDQPGERNYKHHLSVLKSKDQKLIMVYVPSGSLEISLLLPPGLEYSYQWFDPVSGHTSEAGVLNEKRVLNVQNPLEKDVVLLAISAY